MDNLTTCEEHFENLRNVLRDRNISTKYMVYPYNETELWKNLNIVGYSKIFAYGLIILGGLLGNLGIILTVALHKTIRNAINFYVTNLAVTDAVICIVCIVPHALSYYTGGKFIFGAFMCKFAPFTQTTCLTSSVLTLCAISCDRFIAVFRPLHVRTTEKRTSVIIVFIWIMSIVVSLPFLLVKSYTVIEWADFTETYCGEEWPIFYYRDDTTNTCEKRQLIQEIYHVMLSVTFFFLPILIMLLAYSLILWKLWTSKIPGEHNDANVQAQLRTKRKVFKMVIVVLIVFVICWTPLQVLLFFIAFGNNYGKTDSMPTWFIEFEWFSYYIAYANSFMNPFIYGQYNKDFRNGLCMIICCRQRKNRIARFWGGNIITKSIRSMTTTLSTLRTTTQRIISRRISRNDNLELPETRV